jgi:hypothetical protein
MEPLTNLRACARVLGVVLRSAWPTSMAAACLVASCTLGRPSTETRSGSLAIAAVQPASFRQPEVRAIRLTQQGAGAQILSVLSSAGSVTTRADQASPATPLQGVAIRYSDGAMFVLNYSDQTYLKTSLADEAASRLNTRATLGSGTQTGGAAVPLQATIRRTDSWTRIGGLLARAYESTTNGIITRTWYAEGAPLPPHAVRQILASLVPAGSSVDCSCDDPKGVDGGCGPKVAAMEIAGRAALRSEMFDGKQWTVTLNTTDVQWTVEPTTFFAPPGGWTEASASGAPAPLAAAPHVARLTAAATSAANPGSPSANVSWQGGPVMETPELHVYFAGTGFPAAPGAVSELTAAISTIVSLSGISAISEYGINPGTVKDVHVLGGSLADPSASVAPFVLGAMLKYGPLFWWETSSTAPLFVVVVDDDDAGSNWNPFHLDTISPTFLLPFPTNFLAHDFMPFALVGAVQGSLSMPAGGPAQRDTCDRSSLQPAAVCDALPSFDQSTADLAHEIFEAVTDPYPFQGYMDPSKFPWWYDAEVCDICETPSQANRFTRVGDYVLATAWSNGADDCVGPYEPSIRIELPGSGALYSLAAASTGILVEASVWDPIDRGSRLTSEVTWSLDGAPQAFDSASAMGTQVSNMILVQSAGQHVVTANFEDPDNFLPVSDSITIDVRESGPVLVIDSPADGTTVPVGTTITLAGHGTSLDYPNGIPTFMFYWYMGNAVLGNGSTMTTMLNRAGDVTISLESVDNAGLLGTASVTLHVVEPANGPKVTITSPANGYAAPWSFNSACPSDALTCAIAVTFTAMAMNPDGTAVDPSQIQWSDPQDGPLGTGASITHTFTFPYCVNGSASMTASVAGPNGTSTDAVTISFLSGGC